MNPQPPPLVTFVITAAVFAFLCAVFVFVKRRARKRTKALKAEAVQLGLNFAGEEWPDDTPAPTLETALFDEGSGKITNVMTGSLNGMKVSIFDYFRMRYGRRRTFNLKQPPFTQTVGAFSKSGICLPYFQLRPAGMTDKAWDALSPQSIYFDTDPEFLRRFALRGISNDRTLDDQLETFFSPSLREFLETLDPEETWHIEGNGDTLFLYRANQITQPIELRTFFERTSWIATNFLNLAASNAGER
jgi:hypothetical protein